MSLFHGILNNKNTIYSKHLNESLLCLSDVTFVIPDTYQYDYLEVSEKYIARPDLISLMAYGSTEYTDVICKLNGISNPFELNKGMVLIMPTPDCVMQFIVKPSAVDADTNITSTAPKTAKKKNEPRKANEAILTDNRFKIDKSRNIVVY